MKENPYGRISSLHLCAARTEAGECYLKTLRFTAPYKVMSPFRKADGSLQVMILSVSAGLLAGDTQEVHIETEPGAALECTSQSFEKIHRMEQAKAVRTTRLLVGDHSFLSYRPLPVIPFAGSAFESVTQIELAGPESRLVYQEILSCGRAARGERFAYGSYLSRIEARREGKLIYRENCRFRPEEYEMEGMGMFEGWSHLANLLLFGPEIGQEQADAVREYLDSREDVCGGVSRSASGDLVIRVLGNQAQTLQELCEELWKICSGFHSES